MACPVGDLIQGVTTDVGRIAIAKSMLGPLVRPPYAQSFAKYFKIGTGGYIAGPGGTKTPKTPVGNETDLEAAGDPSLFVYQKDFVAADLTYELCSGIPYAVCRAYLEYSEANDDGFGNTPEFFEIGIFDEQDVMLFYATFPGETKTGSKTLNHYIYVSF